MSTAYFAPLVSLTDIVTEPGNYETRCGETVTVATVSSKHNFGCHGFYHTPPCQRERWHKSGRISATRTTNNDIVKKL